MAVPRRQAVVRQPAELTITEWQRHSEAGAAARVEAVVARPGRARLDVGESTQRGVAFVDRRSNHCGWRAAGSIFDWSKRAAVSTAAAARPSRARLRIDGDSGEAGSVTRVDLCTARRKQQPHARGEDHARSP